MAVALIAHDESGMQPIVHQIHFNCSDRGSLFSQLIFTTAAEQVISILWQCLQRW